MCRSSPAGTLALKYTPHMFATQVTTQSDADHECPTPHRRAKYRLSGDDALKHGPHLGDSRCWS